VGVTAEVRYDPEEFKLTFGGEGNNVLNLTNAYADYARASRRARGDVLRKYAGLARLQNDEAARREQTFDDVKGMLLPRVQSRFYHAMVRKTLAGMPSAAKADGDRKADSFESRPFTTTLSLDLVCDLPNAIQTVPSKSLADWGVTFDAALAVAKDNLWRRSNERWEEIGEGVYLSPWRDSHDASRLFLHDLIWQLPVKGEHVAVAPNRIMLLVTGSEDEAGLALLAVAAEQAMGVDRPISGVTLKLEGTRWMPWLPKPDHVAYWALRKLWLQSAAMEYAEQKAELERELAKGGQDVFVATYALTGDKGGARLFSWAVWPSSVNDMLLPETDWVGIETPGGAAKWARFARVREVAAELMEATDHVPVRYRIRRFPSEEQLGRMELVSVPEPF